MSRSHVAALAVGAFAIAVAATWLGYVYVAAMLLPLFVPARSTARSTSASVPQGAWS